MRAKVATTSKLDAALERKGPPFEPDPYLQGDHCCIIDIPPTDARLILKDWWDEVKARIADAKQAAEDNKTSTKKTGDTEMDALRHEKNLC